MAQQIVDLGGEAMTVGANCGKVRRAPPHCCAPPVLCPAFLRPRCAVPGTQRWQPLHLQFRSWLPRSCRPASCARCAVPAVLCPLCPLCLQREDIERMFKEVTEKFGRLDVLVNNAVSQWLQQGGQGGQHAWGRSGEAPLCTGLTRGCMR